MESPLRQRFRFTFKFDNAQSIISFLQVSTCSAVERMVSTGCICYTSIVIIAHASVVLGYGAHALDAVAGIVGKSDSLFMEAKRP